MYMFVLGVLFGSGLVLAIQQVQRWRAEVSAYRSYQNYTQPRSDDSW